MSQYYTSAAALSDGDVVNAQVWNQQVVDNWHWLRGLKIGERELGAIPSLKALPLSMGGFTWIAGAKLNSDFTSLTIPFTLNVRCHYLRIIGSGWRTDRAAQPRDFAGIQMGEYASPTEYWSVQSYNYGSAPAMGENLGAGSVDGHLVTVAAATSNSGVSGSFDITFYNPSTLAPGDSRLIRSFSGVATNTSAENTLRHSGGHIVPKVTTRYDIPYITIKPYYGSMFLVGGADMPVECYLDIYEILGKTPLV